MNITKLITAAKKLEPSGSFFPKAHQRFKATKHFNKVHKLAPKRERYCGHRTFTLHTDKKEKFDPWQLPPKGSKTVTTSTPTQTIFMGGRTGGKTAYAMNAYKQARGGKSYAFVDIEMMNWGWHFVQQAKINDIREKIDHIHSQVCGCKKYVFRTLNIESNISKHRITCRDMDLLEFQLGFEEDLNEVFNGRRTNTRVRSRGVSLHQSN